MAYNTHKRAAAQQRYYLKHRRILAEKRKERDQKDWNYTFLQRRKHRLKVYGLTLSEYEQMLSSQGRKCGICSSGFSDKKIAVVDHNHQTGKVRGLLCKKCNLSLGYLEMGEKTEKLLQYLAQYK